MSKLYSVAMQTSWRPASYWPQALLSLRATGCQEPLHVFCEPDAEFDPRVAAGTVEHRAAEPQGCFPNWKRMLLWMLEHTTTPWLLLLQDDVIWRADAWSQLQLAAEKHPAVGMLSPYTSPKMVASAHRGHPPATEGWHEATFHDNAFVGALALAFPRESAIKLVEHPRFQAHDHHRKVDVIVGNVLRRELGLSIMVHWPSLADHIGEISTLGRHKIKSIQWGRRAWLFRTGSSPASV